MADERIRNLEMAVRKCPGDSGPIAELARAYHMTGETFKACRLLFGYLESRPEDAEIDRALAYARNHFKHYELVPTGTYPQALGNLRNALKKSGETSHPSISYKGQMLARPQTLAEALRADLETYFSGEGDMKLLDTYKDTCTATAYSAKDKKHVLIIPESKNLILLEPTFRRRFIPISGGFEIKGGKLQNPGDTLTKEDKIYVINRTRKDQSYNTPLAENEVSENEGWLYSVEEDRALLKDSAELKFALIAERQHKKRGDVRAMGFYLRQPQEITEDQLRALDLGGLGNDSNAGGDWGPVLSNVQFARVAQK